MKLSDLQHGVWRKVGYVAELLPFAAAMLIVPFVIPTGGLWPWWANTMDLQVYVEAGQTLVHGGDIMTSWYTPWHLAFIYPAFAALIAVPLSFLPYKLLQVIWTLGSVFLIRMLMRRFGVPAGIAVGLLGVVMVVVCQPIRATLGYGQVNIIVMALVLLDLSPVGRRLGPRGLLTGIAAGIKLTPLLFVVYLAALRRWRDAGVALGVFGATTLIGLLVLPRESVQFWKYLIEGETRTGAAYILGNQSVLGGMNRLFGTTDRIQTLGALLGALVGLAAVWAAVRWSRRGEELFALGLVGLGTLMASPLSWTHHFVWILPICFALFRHGLPRSIKVVGGAFALWTFSGLVMQVLPYNQDREFTYTFRQDLVSSLTPMLAVAFVIVALAMSWSTRKARPLPQPVF